MKNLMILSALLLAPTLVVGHGRVTAPPSRATAWRYGFPVPPDYDDTAQNCGGFDAQYHKNGGKCGICGDGFHLPTPRPHELGGTFGRGVIVAKYPAGSTIAVTTDLTMSHQGYWEYRLCTNANDQTQACFDKHTLELETGGTKYYPKRGTAIYTVKYKLPAGVTCEHCVLQWTYTAGNNWGKCSDGSSRLGCGDQEQFRACSDIAVGTSKKRAAEVETSPLVTYLQQFEVVLDVDNDLTE